MVYSKHRSDNERKYEEAGSGQKAKFYLFLFGWMCNLHRMAFFHAFNIGRVAIVTPIATSYSLFTLFLSYLFLRDMERMSSKIIFGTILIVGGVILLSLVK